jgi:hypothetical protein
MKEIPAEVVQYAEHIFSLLENTNDNNPLKIASKKQNQYFCDFLDTMIHLHNLLSERECESIMVDKLQLSRKTYDENQYYEAATELSVISLFSCIGHSDFKYEAVVKDGTQKQPECFVKSLLGGTFYAEAKCPVQNNVNVQSSNTIVFNNAGRANSREEQNILINNMQEGLASQNVQIEVVKNDDNKMLDYLQSASLKFADTTGDCELNLLFVALDSLKQIQDWVNFFYNNKGFFTSNSFAADKPYCYADRPKNTVFVDSKFKNVHFVIFTNNFFRHKNNEVIKGSAWRLQDGFNFALQNPFSDLAPKKPVITEFFTNYLVVYTKDIDNYTVPSSTEVPNYILDAMKIISFVKEELEKKQKKFYWEREKK